MWYLVREGQKGMLEWRGKRVDSKRRFCRKDSHGHGRKEEACCFDGGTPVARSTGSLFALSFVGSSRALHLMLMLVGDEALSSNR